MELPFTKMKKLEERIDCLGEIRVLPLGCLQLYSTSGMSNTKLESTELRRDDINTGEVKLVILKV